MFFKFRIAVINRPAVKIIMNSSYVLTSIILLSRLRSDGMHALPAARVSILLTLRLKILMFSNIICLTREPMTRIHLAAGK